MDTDATQHTNNPQISKSTHKIDVVFLYMYPMHV